MKKSDLQYICTSIGNLAGIPIRIFEGEDKIFFHAALPFPKDPMETYREEIMTVREHIGYYVTPMFDYYGIINSESYKIVIGPSRQVPASENDLRRLAFLADVDQGDADLFLAAMKSINIMPLQSVMQILCVVNFSLNGDKLTLEDIQIHDQVQSTLGRQMFNEHMGHLADAAATEYSHNTAFGVEQTILNYVRHGETEGLKGWLKNIPSVRSGILSDNYLRQYKNTFIVTATVVSRTAIHGGMDTDDALSLSDSYIQKSELLHAAEEIINLQYRMVLDFTERVARLRLGENRSKLTQDVANYVQKHITEMISTEEMAASLFMSRPHLSTKFKAETGVTLTDFILSKKTEEAKRLLSDTDKTIIAISNYLGFSSQGHFARVFKKYAGLSPSEYRERYS